MKTLRVKIIVAGAPGSGKSYFARATEACITAKQFGVSIGKVTEAFSDTSVEMELIIWTLTKGRPRESTHLEYAEAALVLCDLAKPMTLTLTPRWGYMINKMSGRIPIIFVARNVSVDTWDYYLRLKRMAKRHNAACVSVNEEDIESVRNIFKMIAELLLKNHINRKRIEEVSEKIQVDF